MGCVSCTDRQEADSGVKAGRLDMCYVGCREMGREVTYRFLRGGMEYRTSIASS